MAATTAGCACLVPPPRYVADRTATLLREQVGARTRQPRPASPVIDRVAAIVEQLLPLDDLRRREYALWLALVEWERDQPLESHSTIWTDQRTLYRRCVAELTGHPAGADAASHPDERRDAWAGYLHVLTDGLASQMINTPDTCPAGAARALVRGFVAEIARAVGGDALAADQPPSWGTTSPDS